MCGIAGIAGGSADYAPHLTRMLAAMRHRGPDGCGQIAFEGGAAGAVRLALVDLSDRGVQPIWSPDRRVAIIFNGEVYNHAGHRARLAAGGYRFSSATDTEVVLALYLEHGLDFVRHLRGMFALAILDWRESAPGCTPVVVLARDPLGIKPLYLTQPAGPAGPLIFASEIRSLLASGLIPREVDREALVDYLAVGFIIQPRTILAGVRMLERGAVARFVPGRGPEQKIFWTLPAAAPCRETLDESAERLRAALDESVALHAMADAPVGAFLSGGVDSTGIVGLMVRRNPRVRTYTLRIADAPEADESHLAQTAARSLGCEPTVVEITGRELLDLLPRFASEIDQPTNDALNTWLISRAAARDVKGVLSGLGGDEWFSGYPVTRRLARFASGAGRIHRVAGAVASLVHGMVPSGALRRRLDHIAVRAHPLDTWLDDHRVFGYPLARRLVYGASARRNGHSGRERLLDLLGADWKRESPVGLSCRLDVGAYMICQLLRDSDAVSMASSLELRVPLVDVRIAEFARSCADAFKLRPRGGAGPEYGRSGAKQVLIHALRDVLPEDIAQRPKRGFALPHEHWIRHDLGPLVHDTCHRRAVAGRGLLDPDLILELSADRSPTRFWYRWPHTWSILILELWCRAVLDAAPAC